MKLFKIFDSLKMIIIFISVNFIVIELRNAQESNPIIIFEKNNQTLGNTRTFGIATGDVDSDGDIDVLISNYVGATKLWLNNGFGNFELSIQNFNISEVHDASIADFNGDDFLDICLISHASAGKIYLNNGTGQFHESDQNIESAQVYPQYINAADVDNDTDIDLFINNFSGPNRIWLNDGLGNYSSMEMDLGGDDASRFTLDDINNDTFPDLVILMRNGDNKILINSGSGIFNDAGVQIGSGGNDVKCGDIDNDTDIDIAIATDNEIKIWLNEENNGNFENFINIPEGAARFEVVDFDSDGDLDFVTAHISNGNKFWQNEKSIKFNDLGAIFGTQRVLAIECEDLDGDNDIDIIFGQNNNTGENSVYFNESIIVSIKEQLDDVKNHFNLEQNYPNPFNPSTSINFAIPSDAYVSIKIYNSIGKQVDHLVDGYKQAGNYAVTFDASNLPSGIYFYKFESKNFMKINKMALIK